MNQFSIFGAFLWFPYRVMNCCTVLSVLLISLERSSSSPRGCSKKGDDWWPDSCDCSNTNGIVVCRELKSLSCLDELPLDMRSITITKGAFDHMNVSLFWNCSHLKSITVQKSSLKTISPSAFEGLNGSLKTVALENNNDLILHEGVFDLIADSLLNLKLVGSRTSSPKVFASLTSLRKLQLDGESTNGTLGESFSNLLHLETLILQSFAGNVSRRTFVHVTRCRNLVLRYADIARLGEDAFADFENLTRLDLSYNIDLNVSDVLPALRLVSPSIRSLRLTGLTAKSRPTSVLNDDFFAALIHMKNLKQLYLNKNEVLSIRWSALNTPRSLEALDLSYNRLSNVFYLVSEMFLLQNLLNLTIQFQSKRFPSYGREYEDDEDEIAWKSPNGLKMNGHAQNRPDKLPLAGKESGNLDNDNNNNNCPSRDSITCKFPTNPRVGDLDVKNWCLPCPRRLKNLLLDGVINVYLREMPAILLLGDCPVENISLRYNGFNHCGGQIMIDRPTAARPVSIDLAINNMECLSPDLFKFSISRNLTLGQLNLEFNALSNQLARDDEGAVFGRYVDLTILNLADNKLKKLPPNVFKNLSNLAVLNLSRNSLQVLGFDVGHMTKLSVLDISENLFVALNADQQVIFSHLSDRRGYWNFSLHLYGNPLHCSCDTISFMAWIVANWTKIDDFYSLNCLFYGDAKNFSESRAIATELRLFCYAKLPLIVVGSLLGLAMVCSLVAYVFYKYRWDVRYYLLRSGRSLSVKSRNFDYDAFVCYDKRDTTWVLQELIENLESASGRRRRLYESDASMEEGSTLVREESLPEDQAAQPENGNGSGRVESAICDLRLCIHERDFEPGMQIEDNILMAIENSRRVILVISNNFLKSIWCNMELEIARREGYHRSTNLIIAIFLEPVEDATNSLDWLTKHYTYLEWFVYDGYRRHEFWKRLRVSIGSGGRRQGKPLSTDKRSL